MATFTELINRVADMTGTGITNNDPCDEKDLIASFLNEAYQIACQEAQIGYQETTTNVPAAVSGYVLSLRDDFAVTGALMIYDLSVLDSNGEWQELLLTDRDNLNRMRSKSNSAGNTCYYAMYDNDKIAFYPETDQDLLTIRFRFLQSPPELFETGPNSSPDLLPIRWHYDLLANAATAKVLEYDQRPDEAAYYRQLAEGALQSLIGHVNEFGRGPMGARMRNYYQYSWKRKMNSIGGLYY